MHVRLLTAAFICTTANRHRTCRLAWQGLLTAWLLTMADIVDVFRLEP